MKKILYDLPPFHLSEKYKNILYSKEMIGMAICASEDCILKILQEIITLFINQFSAIIFIRSDEETILLVKKYLQTNYQYKETQSVGFLSYKLPEISFILNRDNISFLIENFKDFSSFEIHFANKEIANNIMENIKNHPYKITNENLSGLLEKRELILNKCGDSDELECITKNKYIKGIFRIFTKYFEMEIE